MRRKLGLFALLATAIVVLATPAFAGGTTSTVIPPADHPYGKTYGQWSNAWWLWAHNTPIHNAAGKPGQFIRNGSPTNFAAVDCTLGQRGAVWFLGGTDFSGSSTNAYRKCSIPAGKALFLPVYDAWADNLNQPENTNYTATELRKFASDQVNAATSYAAKVDGQSVAGLTSNPARFRAQSGKFVYCLPKDSLINYSFASFGLHFPKGTHTPPPGGYADGIYLFIKPLAPGQHVLHWKAKDASGAVKQDITYRITVAG